MLYYLFRIVYIEKSQTSFFKNRKTKLHKEKGDCNQLRKLQMQSASTVKNKCKI